MHHKPNSEINMDSNFATWTFVSQLPKKLTRTFGLSWFPKLGELRHSRHILRPACWYLQWQPWNSHSGELTDTVPVHPEHFVSRKLEWVLRMESKALACTHVMWCKKQIGGQVWEFAPQGVPDIHPEISEGTRQPFARHTKQIPLHCRLQWSSATESHMHTHYGRHPYKTNIEVRLNVHSQHSHKCCGIITPLSCCNRCGLVEHGISKHEDINKYRILATQWIWS